MRNKIQNPIFEIINYRYSFVAPKEIEPNSELDILIKIPNLDKTQFLKFSEEITKGIDSLICFQNLPISYEFSFEDLQFLLLYKEESKKNSDHSVAILCFNSLSWCFNYNKQNNYDLNVLLTCFYNLTVSSLKRSFNFCFESILKYLINTSNSFKVEEESINLIFTNIYSNKSLDSSLYPTIISFLRYIIINYSNSNIINQMVLLIDDLISNKSQIFIVEDYTSLILLLQPFISKLDPICFTTICRFSHICEGGVLNDSFVLVPSSLFSFIVSSCHLDDKFDEFYKISSISPFNSSLDIFTFKPSINKEMCNRFKESISLPPYDSLIVDFEFEFDKDIQKLSLNLGKALLLASPKSSQTFMSIFLNLLITIKSSKIFIEVFMSFYLILEVLHDKNIFKIVLPQLVKTLAFNPNQTIFLEEPFYPFVNWIRKRIFNLVNEVDPSLILLLFESSVDFPFLFVENLLRIFHPSYNLHFNLYLYEK